MLQNWEYFNTFSLPRNHLLKNISCLPKKGKGRKGRKHYGRDPICQRPYRMQVVAGHCDFVSVEVDRDDASLTDGTLVELLKFNFWCIFSWSTFILFHWADMVILRKKLMWVYCWFVLYVVIFYWTPHWITADLCVSFSPLL